MAELERFKGIVDNRYSLSDKTIELSQTAQAIVDYLIMNDYYDISYDEDGREEESLYNEVYEYLKSLNR
jgi:hypothetical protein